MQHQRKLVAIDHVPARRLDLVAVLPCRGGARRQQQVADHPLHASPRAASFSLLLADNYCAAVHGADELLPRPPRPSWAAPSGAALLNAGMSSPP